MRSWYRLNARAEADPTTAELRIYDEIGASFWNDNAVSAAQFVADLQALPSSVKAIDVKVSSPGGDVFDAIVIANALREQRTSKGRTVTTTVEGLAASSASLVIMAGDPIRIADNAMVMVHNAWALTVGNAGAHRKMADTLDAIRGAMVATYQWHSPLSDADLIALLDAETWMDADTAIASGFATEKIAGLEADASLSPRVLASIGRIAARIPDRFKARMAAAATPAPLSEVFALCREAGLQELAEELVNTGATTAQARAKVAAAKAIRDTEAALVNQVRGICNLVNLPTLSDPLIAGKVPFEQVKALLAIVTAQIDEARGNIDTSLGPNVGQPARNRPISINEIYDRMNNRTAK